MSKNSSEYDANLALYLQEIAKIPLLTPEDEKHLARTIRTNELTVWVKLLSVNALLPEIWELAHSLRPDRVQDFLNSPRSFHFRRTTFSIRKAEQSWLHRSRASMKTSQSYPPAWTASESWSTASTCLLNFNAMRRSSLPLSAHGVQLDALESVLFAQT